jgi:tetratricopeptide (TPR) repeat protein
VVELETGNLLARVAGHVRTVGLTASSLALVIMMGTSSANAAEKTWQQCLSCGTDELLHHKIADAESSFRQAVDTVERVQHKPDESAECLYQLAHALAMEDKTDESIEYYCRSLHVLEEAYGNRSPKLVTTLYRLGAAYKEKGDHDSAMKVYALAMEISLPHAGPCSPAVASGLEQIGKSQVMGSDEPNSESLKAQASHNASHRKLAGFSQPEQDLQADKENSDKSLLVDSQRQMAAKRRPSWPNSEMLSTSPSAQSLEPQQEL